MPPAAPAFSAPAVSPSAASAAAALAPAAPAPAQQHARTQFRTITPPKIPQTAGSAVCGLLLPTRGTLGPAETTGNSGTVGTTRATSEAAPVGTLATSGTWRRSSPRTSG